MGRKPFYNPLECEALMPENEAAPVGPTVAVESAQADLRALSQVATAVVEKWTAEDSLPREQATIKISEFMSWISIGVSLGSEEAKRGAQSS